MTRTKAFVKATLFLALAGCYNQTRTAEFKQELKDIKLLSGDIALCGSGEAKLGTVSFGLSCEEQVRADFNTAVALLHSFEYSEAEKVFAKVLDADPACVMAYWGVAMSNFHPLWAPPTEEELEKGARAVALARKLKGTSEREADYLKAIGAYYDFRETRGHAERVLAFEQTSEANYRKYPEDKEAAIFYALALRAAADPADKTFARQLKAGEILNNLFPSEPDHPGIAHYLIHTYDYPELADRALPAARKYASIAATSAHALHMPSHIFTRLGLWQESVESNLASITAAQCYAENSGIDGHWDEEIHGIDYLVYAYLQQGRDDLAAAQLDYLRSIKSVYPQNNKVAYTFASVPTRLAVELKDWEQAAKLELVPANFPWEAHPWERSNVSFGRLLGFVHLKKPAAAAAELDVLRQNHRVLTEKGRAYEANQVAIQVKAGEAWLSFLKGDRESASRLMTEAAQMEDATDKHPLTPGEVIPARELLGDLYFEMMQFGKALEAYEENLKRHPGRLNGIYGAALASEKLGYRAKADRYFSQIQELTKVSDKSRASIQHALKKIPTPS